MRLAAWVLSLSLLPGALRAEESREPQSMQVQATFWPVLFDAIRSITPASAQGPGGGVSGSSDVTWTGTQTFRDNKFVITDDADTTKVLNFQLSSIGTGTTVTYTWPNITGTVILSSGSQVLVSGASESKVVNNSGYLDFGTSQDARISYLTNQTPDTLAIEVPSSSRTLIIAERPDTSQFDYAVALQTNPTVVVPSANQTVEQRIGIAHDQTQGRIMDMANTAASQRPVALHGGAAVASAATITPTGNVFHVTGTTGITAVTAMASGTKICIIFDGVLTVTDDGAALNLAGNFSTTANDVLCLISDGTNWVEASRSVN